MESDVTTTLSELERKLKELERELESVGRGGELDADPAQAGWTPPPDAGVPAPAANPGPPPPGATPFTAAWHGGGSANGPAAAPPPASPFNGAPPVAVTPPPPPWPAPTAVPPPAPSAPTAALAPAPAPSPYAAAPASGLHRQLDELLAFRDRLVRTTDDLVAELSRVLTELGAEVAPDPAETVLSGAVTVDAAPFGDLATLAAFEQALARTPGVAEVYVRTLDAGRATIDVRLAGPVALAAALRASAPVAFAVTDVRQGRLTLTLSGPGSAPPA
ncbi:MAG: hypothetical protein QOF86_962 [Baekduia sp.]|nr:hypothetical protein [Baekduia sp.]